MPDEVRAEIGSYFVDTPPIIDDDSRKLPKLDDSTAQYIHSGLTVSNHFFWVTLYCFCSFVLVLTFMFYFQICSQGGVTQM